MYTRIIQDIIFLVKILMQPWPWIFGICAWLVLFFLLNVHDPVWRREGSAFTASGAFHKNNKNSFAEII